LSQPPATPTIGSPFIELQSVDSTNNYARTRIRASGLPERQGGDLHGMAIFAHDQVAGKGQRGKSWVAQKDQNIALSVLLKPAKLAISQQFQLSAAVAVATAQFFRKYAGDECRVKWPNDLYWQDRKAGGILIENIISGSGTWEWAIVGIGININQVRFPDDLPNPVSLKQITGKDSDPCLLAKELCLFLDEQYTRLGREGFPGIYQDYCTNLYKIGQLVKLKKETRVFEALVKNVTPEGRLLVQHATEEEYNFGEVEWVLQ
jgi:BirA family transcriptional regulator, biotin operon repressor / biotin---[acetyl-CoA-carboxylase] ligase